MTVFWDVDTQKDFMYKNGKLYVPNAEKIIPNLKALTNYARKNDTKILGSVDRHFANDKELETFPKHCMNKTEGQKKIPETLLKHHVFVSSKIGEHGKYDGLSNNELQIYERNFQQILFEKQTINVFDNRDVKKFLDKIRVGTAIVYGVATDYCVKDAVLGLLNLGIKVYLVCDAIKGIEDKAIDSALWAMYHTGAKAITTKQVLERKYE